MTGITEVFCGAFPSSFGENRADRIRYRMRKTTSAAPAQSNTSFFGDIFSIAVEIFSESFTLLPSLIFDGNKSGRKIPLPAVLFHDSE